MSNGEARRLSRKDIQMVQNLIERCLQLYMKQKEVVATLLDQAKIEPGFTELVWQKLEEENQEFFRAYRARLLVKQQITVFNKMLEKQAELMGQMCPTGESSMSNPGGSHISPTVPHPSSACYASGHNGLALKPEIMQPPIGSTVPNTFTNGKTIANGGSSFHPSVGMSAQAGRMVALPDMLSTQSSDMGLAHGIDARVMKTEGGYGCSSSFICGSEGNVLETCHMMVDGSVPSFSNMESSQQPLNGPLFDTGTASFGVSGQIRPNFSFSDLTADGSQLSALYQYPGQPFLDQGDDRKLDGIAEGSRYDRFGSN